MLTTDNISQKNHEEMVRHCLSGIFCAILRCSDDVAPLGPLTQRLIAGLVEENVLVSDIENKGTVVVIRKSFSNIHA